MTWEKDNIFWSIGYDPDMGDVIVMASPVRFVFKGKEYTVPIGFASDGMSVPRFFWRTLSPKLDFKTLIPSVIHDFMYANHIGTRKEADLYYLDNLIKNGFGSIKARLVYWGVRLGGGSHY